ncbi:MULTISPECIES: dethiobiotin synthase [unclassified Janibacter]|uniref:dethiobiotin synthase n=1 Tax=unclassified Janibacter TaxID=2649294 RepID=UPI003CFBF2AE
MSARATLPRIVIVTGTDTGVGKTVVTAALAAALAAAGRTVAAYKPVQTGIGPGGQDDDGMPEDMAVVARLAGVPTAQGCRLRAPMAPRQAAVEQSAALPTLSAHVATIEDLAASHDHVLVEGAGGLLVQLTDAGEDLRDLADALVEVAATGFVVVARSGLGTLNHTALTLESLAARGLPLVGVALGCVPPTPSRTEELNHAHLAPDVVATVPAGASALAPATFRAATPDWWSVP